VIALGTGSAFAGPARVWGVIPIAAATQPDRRWSRPGGIDLRTVRCLAAWDASRCWGA
jgi:hypothetical protein